MALNGSPQVGRMLNRDGRINVVRLGLPQSRIQDLYHYLLVIGWPKFFGLIAVLYVMGNTLFALAYLVSGQAIANADPGSFWDAFYFSVQTMGSIGYGYMYPQTPVANLLVMVESMVGLLGIAMGTGLLFARFSRPTARVMFSQVAVVTPHNGIPTLMFRAANQRHNQILEAQLWVSLIRSEITSEGQFMRRFYDLALVRHRNPVFALTWTVMHPIDEKSPLFGSTPDSLALAETELLVSLTGLDETFAQTIHARHSYVTREIFWNHRFADTFLRTPDGQRAIDFRRFHEVVALKE